MTLATRPIRRRGSPWRARCWSFGRWRFAGRACATPAPARGSSRYQKNACKDQYYGHYLPPRAPAFILVAVCIKSYTISRMAKTLKPIYWEGTSKSDLMAFPEDAKQAAGYQLHRLQEGNEPLDWKPLKNLRKGSQGYMRYASGRMMVPIEWLMSQSSGAALRYCIVGRKLRKRRPNRIKRLLLIAT